ncbi:class I SAM-dependent methyltransferase [Actinomyces israelii]
MPVPDSSIPPLHRGAGARRHHQLRLRDRTEVAAALEGLADLTGPGLADLRVLELACGSGRLTLPLATAGHRVLATDIDPQALEHLSAGLAHHARAAARIELRTADMTAFSFEESFKAVCLSTSSITQPAPSLSAPSTCSTRPPPRRRTPRSTASGSTTRPTRTAATSP